MSCAIFDPLAEAELIDAATWYERESRGAGLRLIESAQAACELLLERPELGEEYRYGVRRKRLLRYEYYIYYRRENNGDIYIVAFAHEKRGPDYLRKLLER